uniref:KEN domain-containing protein n=1 Tax=Panagrolaimus sp. JU765 TaxID=591449 RepID=A0AC34PWR3_9BILA
MGSPNWISLEDLVKHESYREDDGNLFTMIIMGLKSFDPKKNAEIHPANIMILQDANKYLKVESCGYVESLDNVKFILFFILDKGTHPYPYCSIKKLSATNFFQTTAVDLLEKIEKKYYKAVENIEAHPLFWDNKKRLDYLADVSNFNHNNRISEFKKSLTEKEWTKELPQKIQEKYNDNPNTINAMLRGLRNCCQHYHDSNIREYFKKYPDDHIYFWTSKFPKLLIYVYNVVLNYYDIDKNDESLLGYYITNKRF